MKLEAARPIKAEKHLWYQYNGRKPITITDTKGQKLVLKKGDLYGLYNLNNRIDRIALPSRSDIRYFLKVEDSSDILDVSKRHKEPVAFSDPPPKAPKIKKIVIAPKAPKAEKPKADRAAAIKKAVKTAKKVEVDPRTIDTAIDNIQKKLDKSRAKKKREQFDLDEDTFADYSDLGDF